MASNPTPKISSPPKPVVKKPVVPLLPTSISGVLLKDVAGTYTLKAALVCDGPLIVKTIDGAYRHAEPRSVPTGEQYVVLKSGERANIRTGIISPAGFGDWQAVPVDGIAVLQPYLTESFEIIIPIVVYGADVQSIFTTTALMTFQLSEKK